MALLKSWTYMELPGLKQKLVTHCKSLAALIDSDAARCVQSPNTSVALDIHDRSVKLLASCRCLDAIDRPPYTTMANSDSLPFRELENTGLNF